jgi:hypothetical protein
MYVHVTKFVPATLFVTAMPYALAMVFVHVMEIAVDIIIQPTGIRIDINHQICVN